MCKINIIVGHPYDGKTTTAIREAVRYAEQRVVKDKKLRIILINNEEHEESLIMRFSTLLGETGVDTTPITQQVTTIIQRLQAIQAELDIITNVSNYSSCWSDLDKHLKSTADEEILLVLDMWGLDGDSINELDLYLRRRKDIVKAFATYNISLRLPPSDISFYIQDKFGVVDINVIEASVV